MNPFFFIPSNNRIPYFPLFYTIARSTSNEFLRRKRGIFHPGLTACEEQKREAREDYGMRRLLIWND